MAKKPFIQYTVSVGKAIQEEVQLKTNELISQDLKFTWAVQPLGEIEKEVIYLQPGLPKNKPLRVLRLEGISAVADGGTIVFSLKEIGSISITAIEDNGSETIVRYRVESLCP